VVAGQDVSAMSERERTAFRRETVAFIFQSFGLIPILSAAENAGVPLRIAGVPAREREERVAIARALAGNPQLLIADEPTGQLDSQTGRQILRLIRTVVRSEGITALVATHDPVLIDLADTAFRLDDGVLTQL
jgi:putative ABC transport system ATP-binding protein